MLKGVQHPRASLDTSGNAQIRAAPTPDFSDTSSAKYCCYMHSQVQVPILINGKNNVECAVMINFIIIFSLINIEKYCANNRIGTSIMCDVIAVYY